MKRVLLMLVLVPMVAMAGLKLEDEPARPAAPLPVAAASAPTVKAELKIQPAQRWQVQISDGTLSRALLRWADHSGVQLVWEAPQDKPALKANYEGTLEEALTQVMLDTQSSPYKLHACAFDNVIRVLHTSQRCTQ